jgi:hypothetical protein
VAAGIHRSHGQSPSTVSVDFIEDSTYHAHNASGPEQNAPALAITAQVIVSSFVTRLRTPPALT